MCISACLCMILCVYLCTCVCARARVCVYVCVLDLSSFSSFILRKKVFGNTELDFILLFPSEFSTSYVLNQCLLVSRKETEHSEYVRSLSLFLWRNPPRTFHIMITCAGK